MPTLIGTQNITLKYDFKDLTIMCLNILNNCRIIEKKKLIEPWGLHIGRTLEVKSVQQYIEGHRYLYFNIYLYTSSGNERSIKCW